MVLLIIKCVLLLLLAFCGTAPAEQCPTFTPDKNFKIEEYTGVWYGIARFPNIPQENKRCDKATYTLNANGTLSFLNQAAIGQDQNEIDRGLITVINPNIPGALQAFEDFVTYPYSVLETDYRHYASVYSCSIHPNTGIKNEAAYILSREKTLNANKLRKALKPYIKIGVDITKFFKIPQDC